MVVSRRVKRDERSSEMNGAGPGASAGLAHLGRAFHAVLQLRADPTLSDKHSGAAAASELALPSSAFDLYLGSSAEAKGTRAVTSQVRGTVWQDSAAPPGPRQVGPRIGRIAEYAGAGHHFEQSTRGA